MAEIHDRNLPEREHVLFPPVSGASFWRQFLVPEKNGARNPVHTSKFSGTRNLRVATETFQSERSFRLVRTTLSAQCNMVILFGVFVNSNFGRFDY